MSLKRSLPVVIAVIGLLAIAANLTVYLVARDKKTRDTAVAVCTPIIMITAMASAFVYKRRLASDAPVIPTHPMITSRSAAPLRPGPPIQSVRELLGPAPRSFDPGLQKYLHLKPPDWMSDDPELAVAYENQDRIRRNGDVVWAAHVQANKLLFDVGPCDHPASVIFSEDRWFDDHPEALFEVGHALFSLKGTDPTDPELSDFARMLSSEMTRAPMLKVPAQFTNGRAVFHSSIVLPRKHLPKGVLCRAPMPVWIDPAGTGALLLVPAAYWPASLLSRWSE